MNGYRVSFPGVKRLGSDADNSSPSIPEVKTGRAIHLLSQYAFKVQRGEFLPFYIPVIRETYENRASSNLTRSLSLSLSSSYMAVRLSKTSRS